MKQLTIIAALFLSMFVAELSFAATPNTPVTKKTIRAIRCPEIIGNKKDGTYSLGSDTSQLLCFRSVKDAKTAGFVTKKSAQKKDFTGWYRVTLKRLISNSCDDLKARTGPVLFFQVKDHGEGVFGQFCPSLGDMSGIRDGSGFVISGAEDTNENPDNSMCVDGKIRIHRYVKMTRSSNGSDPTLSVTYKEVVSCQNPSTGASVCSREYSGVAALETHKLWPSVSPNIFELTNGCGVALQTCASCHQGIDFSQLRP